VSIGRLEAFRDGVLLPAAIAYYVLARTLVSLHGRESTLTLVLTLSPGQELIDTFLAGGTAWETAGIAKCGL